MKSKTSAISVLLAVVLTLSAVAPAFATTPAETHADDAKRAEQIVKVAEAALFKVESFVNSTLQNANITSKLESLGLMEQLNGNASLLDQAKALLADAKEDLAAGNYTDTVMKAIEAMKTCREVFKNVHIILEQAGVEAEAERPEVQAQGLLVAANRSLERIERIENILSEANELFGEAKALLNITEIRQLLSAGNVSEVAHRLAEANRLIAQAYSLLRSKAEGKMAEKMERFRAKVEERISEIAGNMSEKELGEVMRRLGFAGVSNFTDFIKGVVEQAKEQIKAGKVGEAIEKLKEISDKVKEFAKAYRAREIPPVSENLSLNVSVEVSQEKYWTMVKVTVENTGNATVAFPNSALGCIIEKNADGRWIPCYSPISAQIIVKLKPGEAKSFSIKLPKLEAGQYRVVVNGFSEKTMVPISASAEFTIG